MIYAWKVTFGACVAARAVSIHRAASPVSRPCSKLVKSNVLEGAARPARWTALDLAVDLIVEKPALAVLAIVPVVRTIVRQAARKTMRVPRLGHINHGR